jgi:hypothetical protein
MTENSESGAAGKAHTGSRNPALEGDSGQYVEGDYGDAGVAGQESDATSPRVNIRQGTTATRELSEPSAEVDEGEYPEGDYGRAGTVGQELPGDEEGEYPEGDYGGAGTAPEGGAAEELKNDDGGTSSGG